MTYPHLTGNTRGVRCIDGTRHRVIDLVADHMAHGYSAAQIVEQYPDLTLAQVHAALAYYYDHEDAMNAALMASYTQAEHQRHQHPPHPKLLAARVRQTDECSASTWTSMSKRPLPPVYGDAGLM